MKTIREVCKIVGVTRRTLQEYDRIGLLSPANRDTRLLSNDAWLYSDQDIWRLIEIQIFVAAGYERKEIKEILDAPDFDMQSGLETCIQKLNQEKDRITHRILIFRSIAANTPIDSVRENDPSLIFQNHSFKEVLDDAAPENIDLWMKSR